MDTPTSIAFSLAVIAAFGLGFAGLRMLTGRADRTRAMLMIAAGAVILANVLIWTL